MPFCSADVDDVCVVEEVENRRNGGSLRDACLNIIHFRVSLCQAYSGYPVADETGDLSYHNILNPPLPQVVQQPAVVHVVEGPRHV